VIARYIIYSLAWFFATIIGLFGGYHLARYTGIGDGIWGNSIDGYCGDTNYKSKEAKAWFRKLWPCYWWSCIRNPAHNLAKNILCAEGTIESITIHGRLSIVVMDGKKYFFYYKRDGYPVKLGWKLWANEIQVGEYYRAEWVLNP